MLKAITLEIHHSELIVGIVKRNQLHYHEYSFIGDDQLKKYFVNKTTSSLNSSDTHAIAVISDGNIMGIITCTKDHFDSENFGFACYRITDLLVFSEEFNEVNLVVKNLISTLEDELSSISKPFYLFFSLNSNMQNADHIFNSLTKNNFYFIHTLLTFRSKKQRFESRQYFPEENILIRTANKSDVEQVANIAQGLFKFSRFHLDPFLDNERASLLLKRSAENSILQEFVDIMFVAEIQDKVVAYYSAKKRYIADFDKTVGDIVISAVDSKFRGLGLFSKLDDHILNWFADNTDFAEMGTYLGNYPVHKTWINKGLGLVRGTHQFSKFIE